MKENGILHLEEQKEINEILKLYKLNDLFRFLKGKHRLVRLR